MHRLQGRVEHDALEGSCGVLAVAIPSAARDEIDMSVTINVQNTAADIRRRIPPQEKAAPPVRGMILIPEDVPILLTHDILQPAVTVEVSQGRLGISALRKVGVNDVMLKSELHL